MKVDGHAQTRMRYHSGEVTLFDRVSSVASLTSKATPTLSPRIMNSKHGQQSWRFPHRGNRHFSVIRSLLLRNSL